MFVEKTGKELLSSGFRGGVGGSPDFLPVPLENRLGLSKLANSFSVPTLGNSGCKSLQQWLLD